VYLAAADFTETYCLKSVQRVRAIKDESVGDEPFNAGIKSLRATLPAEVLYWGF
jgi:hypothetical protein